MTTVGIGIIGAGFLAETRARCYTQVGGAVRARIVAVAARTEASAGTYAARHRVPFVTTDHRALLERPDVQLVELCVPNHLHRPLAEAAAAAGKHVVCTKPLTAYVGQDLPAGATDADVAGRDRREMLRVVEADAAAMVDAAKRAGVQLMYGENWVYAPAIRRAERLVRSTGGSILEMRGGECHSGSHSPYSRRWRFTGGGALLRLGAHPIGAMLHLKRLEGLARSGRPIRPVAVTAETADVTRVPRAGRTWIATGWEDVETWAAAILTFDDGSRAVVHASDAVLGGMTSRLEIFLSNSRLECCLSPNDLLRAYAPDAEVFGEEYLQEKLETRAGWSTPMPDEDWTSGHLAMCQDFVEAVATGRPSRADGELGLEVVRVVYAAYLAAATGLRVSLDDRVGASSERRAGA
ncbi:MAG TPA: Gfo/Idh/MocA family oxidoreductase [Candidatus Tectomicrobia bacterium]|nr:Gfo/Idh/MocA family oxidoreductase [Candidatus Tectomicrobia bacterium]